MPKRKRSDENNLQARLEKAQNEVFRTLKAAKGFERQRLSKRIHDSDVPAEKRERLEREIAVLKSLDLHQTARAHLFSSLLRIKSIAASTDIPDELRNGVPKPELSEEDRASLHNVTSGLYNRDPVKQAIDASIKSVCEVLGLPVPKKGKAKRVRKSDIEGKGEQPSNAVDSESATEKVTILQKPEQTDEEEEEDEDDEETDFEGFESDKDEPGSAVGDADVEVAKEEETAFSKYDHLLGGSSEDEEGDFDADIYKKYRGKEKVNLDDISVSGSDADSISESEEESIAESSSRSPSPQPQKKKKAKSAAKIGPITDSTFLPSLMGGYISGSESASDVDVAPAKKRLGQRQRQAIWEKKYGAGAKHVQTEVTKSRTGGRDSGWDMKRGAVDGEESRTPWKKGVRSPFSGHGAPGRQHAAEVPVEKVKSRDDEGQLHPSWMAKKKAEAQKAATFSGQKVVFD